MTDRSKLLALAERVAGYDISGPYAVARERERELNEEIATAIGLPCTIRVGHPVLGNERTIPARIPAYTASIDAALTLLPKGQDVMFAMIDGRAYAGLGKVRADNDQEAASIPLALTAACLRARAQAEALA